MKISFIQQTNEKGEALNNVLLCTPEPSSQWIFSLHSHSLLKERLLLSFCLRFSSSRGKHVARAKGMSCARGRLLTRLLRALTPWLIPSIIKNQDEARAPNTSCIDPHHTVSSKVKHEGCVMCERTTVWLAFRTCLARLLDLSPSLFALRFFAFPLTESLTHKFKITRNARSTANIYWRL